jgi:hypothetical protein
VARLLDRLNRGNSKGVAFQRLWQKTVETIEGQFTDILSAISSLSEVAPISIVADYQGTVDPTDQLPYEVAIKRYSGDTDVTTSTAWSVATTSGDITASIGAATGILSVSAVGSSGALTVTSIYNGITKTRLVPVTLFIAAPPSTGSSGAGSTTSSDTSFSSINSTTHAAISDELTVTVGGSGTVTLSAVLTVRTARSAPTGTFPVFGKWEWWDGAAWQDVAAEAESDPDCIIAQPETIYELNAGTLTLNTSKGGLAPAASEKFRVMARNSSGTRIMTFIGTASAVP